MKKLKIFILLLTMIPVIGYAGNINDDFIKAVEENKSSVVRNLIKDGADVNYRNSTGLTALHIAAKKGYTSIVSTLTKSGANVNNLDRLGNTPLMYAIEYGSLSIVKALLDSGANPAAVNKAKQTPRSIGLTEGRADIVELLDQYEKKYREKVSKELEQEYFNEIRSISLEKVERLIRQGLDPKNYRFTDYALSNQRTDVLKMLIKSNFTVRWDHEYAIDKIKLYPVFIPIVSSDSELLQLFLDKGADLEKEYHGKTNYTETRGAFRSAPDKNDPLYHEYSFSQTYKGLNPIQMAIVKEDYKILDTFFKYDFVKEEKELISTALEYGLNNAAQYLIQHGVRLSSKEFLPAVVKGDMEVFQFISKNKFNLDYGERGEHSDSLLIRAMEMREWDMAAYLINKKLYDPRNKDGALSRAAKYGSLEIVKKLVDSKTREEVLKQCLTSAISNYDTAIVEYLITQYIDVNTSVRDESSILIRACSNLDIDMVNMLIRHHCDVNKIDRKGNTALDYLIKVPTESRSDRIIKTKMRQMLTLAGAKKSNQIELSQVSRRYE